MKTSGSLAQCLREYASTLPQGTKDATQKRLDLQDFLGLTSASTERIVTNKTKLLGLTLVKIPRFLEHKGFAITELERMPAEVRMIGDALAYGLIDTATLQSELGYIHPNSVYRLVTGVAKVSKLTSERRDVIVSLSRDLSPAIKRKRAEWGQKIVSITQVAKRNPNEPQSEPVKPAARTQSTMSNDELILAGLIRSIKEPLKRLLATTSSPADREHLREIIGRNTLFDVSTDLNRLGSETAFQQYARHTSGSRT